MCRIQYLIIIIMTIYNTIYVDSLPNVETHSDTLSNLTSGNDLWSSLLRDCLPPTFTCIRNNIYEYLRSTLDYPDDVQFTSFLKFSKNFIDYSNKTVYEDTTNDRNYSESLFGESFPAEEVSRSLTKNTVKFFMTHDLEVKLPEEFFFGTTVKISPKAFEDDGPIFKLQLIPKSLRDSNGEGRLFFKKIRKFISQRLIYALLAILLVIKLLAVKLIFVLPTIVGVAAAKKLLLKVLLFLFPALHHLFKLCAYVPYGTKHHIHKHQISHIHEISNNHHHYPGAHYKRKDYIETDSSQGPLSLYQFAGHRVYESPHEISHKDTHYIGKVSEIPRKDLRLNNEVGVWNQNKGVGPTKYLERDRPFTPTEMENMAFLTDREAELRERLLKQKRKLQQENILLQDELSNAIKIQQKLKEQASQLLNSKIPLSTISSNIYNTTHFSPVRPDLLPGVSIPEENMQLSNRNEQYNYKNSVKSLETSKTTKNHMYATQIIHYDPFYAPILKKIDKTLNMFGLSEDSCKEKLICNMYKNPSKFSPHSNLVSVELSRDSKDLQKPTSSNPDVIRFYRYVQAARDGQDKRNCTKLYPTCTFNTDSSK